MRSPPPTHDDHRRRPDPRPRPAGRLHLKPNAVSTTALLGSAADGVDHGLDALLGAGLDRAGPAEKWSLADGVAGVELYAVLRARGPLLRRAVDALGRCRDEVGRWPTDDVVLLGDRPAESARRFVDAGVTHGLGGLVGVLALAARAGDPEAAGLLVGATGQLVAAAEAEPRGDALAWCCSGLGVAAGLAQAMPLLAHHAPGALLARLLDDAGRASVGTRRGVGLCHGTAGAFVALRRLAACTGVATTTDAARRWGRQLLDAVDGGRVGDGQGLLDGRAGVALALASATGEETGWERALMLP